MGFKNQPILCIEWPYLFYSLLNIFLVLQRLFQELRSLPNFHKKKKTRKRSAFYWHCITNANLIRCNRETFHLYIRLSYKLVATYVRSLTASRLKVNVITILWHPILIISFLYLLSFNQNEIPFIFRAILIWIKRL